MNYLDVTFGSSGWEQFLDRITPGGTLDGVQFLAMMEQESEETQEEALQPCRFQISAFQPRAATKGALRKTEKVITTSLTPKQVIPLKTDLSA